MLLLLKSTIFALDKKTGDVCCLCSLLVVYVCACDVYVVKCIPTILKIHKIYINALGARGMRSVYIKIRLLNSNISPPYFHIAGERLVLLLKI